MRYVKIANPIQIKNLSTGEAIAVDGSTEPWTLYEYLVRIVLTDPAMGTGYDADLARDAVRLVFQDAKPGGTVQVEDAHHTMLCTSIKSPEASVSSIVTMQLVPFQTAIVEASRIAPGKLEQVTG
jgi:predicted methyltransferase